MNSTNTLKRGFVLILIGCAYALWVQVTHLYIPCVFRLITGFQCPGCGVSHMCMAMLKGQFTLAYQANPYLFVTWPYIVFELLMEKRLRQDPKMNGLNQLSLAFYLVGLMVFGIMRNL